MNTRLEALTARVKALKGNRPPTYEEFAEQWSHMDALSKSLLETGLGCPELVGASGPYWDVVWDHLKRMGVPMPEPFTIDEILQGLETDDEGH